MNAFQSMPLKEALQTYVEAHAGNAEALEFLGSLYQPTDECFTCGKELGQGWTPHVINDPKDVASALIIATYATSALPKLFLRHRITKLKRGHAAVSLAWGRIMLARLLH